MPFCSLWNSFISKRLYQAVLKKNLEKATLLLRKGADPNVKSKGWPVIFSALDNPEMLQLLIDYKADINTRNPNKQYTPLIFSIVHNLFQSAEILIKHHADLEPVSFAGLPAVFYAVAAPHDHFLKLFLHLETDKKFLEGILKLSQERDLNPENIAILQKYINALD